MPLANINPDWMPNASSSLCIIIHDLYYMDPLICILGVFSKSALMFNNPCAVYCTTYTYIGLHMAII